MVKIGLLLLVCVVGSCCVLGVCRGSSLSKNFYEKTCPNVEQIVQNLTWARAARDPTLPARLIRMHFHDCFVRGCDASVLLNSTVNNEAEKDAFPNLSLGGFEFIDKVKAKLEKACPGVVSCADIIALVARDSISFILKRKMSWEVPMGRRDGMESRKEDVERNIPAPFNNFTTLLRNFNRKNLNVKDLVVLSGAHTIGIGHCNLFTDRLYNFKGQKGVQDPSMNKAYASFLKTKCPNIDSTNFVEMDPNSSITFDTGYYTNLLQKKGLFTSDAALLTNREAAKWVERMVNYTEFLIEFGRSMKKMGAIGVLTGSCGEIRKNCRAVNS